MSRIEPLRRYVAAVVAIWITVPVGLGAQSNSEYYPLALGNVWKYEVQQSGSTRKSHISWKVTSVDQSKEGPVYQVWPNPMDEDDSAMQLVRSPQGLRELTTGVILPVNLSPGGEWSSGEKGRGRHNRVVSAGKACTAVNQRVKDCLVIEDVDEAARLRTVTTYARGIGPVRYVYYRTSGRQTSPVQTVDLVSYKLAPRP